MMKWRLGEGHPSQVRISISKKVKKHKTTDVGATYAFGAHTVTPLPFLRSFFASLSVLLEFLLSSPRVTPPHSLTSLPRPVPQRILPAHTHLQHPRSVLAAFPSGSLTQSVTTTLQGRDHIFSVWFGCGLCPAWSAHRFHWKSERLPVDTGSRVS